MLKIDTVKTRNAIKTHPLWQTAILASTHLLNDFYTNFLSPVLPILITNFGLTKFEAGTLNAFLQWPSVIQPFVGRWADKTNLQKYIFILPLITGIFISLIGVAPNTTLIAIMLFIGGLSSATFHAVASPVAGKVSGKHTGKGLSLWMVGGEVGWMLSPILIIAFINTFSFKKIPYLIIPTALITALLYFRLKKIDGVRNHVKITNGSASASLKATLPILVPMIALAITRSMIQSTTSVYVPTYLTEMGANLWLAGATLSLTTGGGVLGAIAGGVYKDKVGGKPVLFASMVGSVIFFFLFLYSTQFLQIAALFFTGFFSGLYLPVALAMVQEYSPENRSFATGIYQAFLFTIGSVASMTIGYLYDRLGAQPTFTICGIVGLIGVIFVLFIPGKKKPEAKAMQEA
jgi:FSR family fosmidomycin resistance protein-like MFS transporter